MIGTLCVWHWANWQEAEWRRVSRRRRSHKSGKGGASGNAAMEPLMVCLHVLSAHEGQITSLYVNPSCTYTLYTPPFIHLYYHIYTEHTY